MGYCSPVEKMQSNGEIYRLNLKLEQFWSMCKDVGLLAKNMKTFTFPLACIPLACILLRIAVF